MKSFQYADQKDLNNQISSKSHALCIMDVHFECDHIDNEKILCERAAKFCVIVEKLHKHIRSSFL